MKKLAAVLALATFQAAAQEPVRPFHARSEVAVRIVRVVLTNRGGKPLERPPSPNDFEVLEGGRAAEVLDVERLFTIDSESPSAPNAPTRPVAAESVPKARNVLYFETTFLSTAGLREAARALGTLVPRMASHGSVEIVLADPEPKVFLAPTRAVTEVRASLEKLAATVSGRDWLAEQRAEEHELASSQTNTEAARLMVYSGDSAATEAGRARPRDLNERTVALNVLDRLVHWASRREPEPGGVFVLVTDGFDLDPARSSERLAGNEPQRARDDPRGQDPSVRLRLAETNALLGSVGFAVFPLAVGPERFVGMAEAKWRSHIDIDPKPAMQSMRRAFESRVEPLALAAAATGGEVSTTGDQLGGSLDRLSESYLITFHSTARADGKLHELVVRSKRPDMLVRAPATIAGGTPDSAARVLVLGILGGDAPPAGLGVEATLTPGAAAGSASLKLRIRLGNVPELLTAVGEGRLRVSVAIARGKDAPLVNQNETPLAGSGEGRIFVYEAPIAGIAPGDRVSVLVEELETGFAGGSIVTMTAPAPVR